MSSASTAHRRDSPRQGMGLFYFIVQILARSAKFFKSLRYSVRPRVRNSRCNSIEGFPFGGLVSLVNALSLIGPSSAVMRLRVQIPRIVMLLHRHGLYRLRRRLEVIRNSLV